MHGRHLTRRGTAWVFQMRLPADCGFCLRTPPIRITLGRIPKRCAQRAARVLAMGASIQLERMRRDMMTGQHNTNSRTEIVARLRSDAMALLPLLAGLDDVDRCSPSVPELAPRMVAAGLDGLADLACDRAQGGILARNQGKALEGYFRRVITDEATAREHLGEPPLPMTGSAAGSSTDLLGMFAEMAAKQDARAAEMAARQEAMAAQLAAMSAKARGPLFSQAADAYYTTLLEAHGPTYDELKYILHRKAVFLALCEDKPVNEYSQQDLQTFVNDVSFMPPNISKTEDYDIQDVRRYIEQAKTAGVRGIAESTLVNNYLGKVKTIIRSGCLSAKIPYPLENARIIIPKGVRKKRVRLAPDYESLNHVFAEGVASGMLTEAMLPLLGFLTGRRLGLLTFLRREDIIRYHGCWHIVPRSVVWTGEKFDVVPFKTDESLSGFVLHDILDRIGFIEWARSGTGFIFDSLHDARDPADNASKRMSRLFRKAGLDPRLMAKFHGLRHAKINRDRELKIDPRTIRLQVGHETADVHEGYGQVGMNRTEAQEIAEAPLPSEIDLSIFNKLDFAALASIRPFRGRPRKRT